MILSCVFTEMRLARNWDLPLLLRMLCPKSILKTLIEIQNYH